MGDSLITIVAIFLAAILMFVFPLATISEMNDVQTQSLVQARITEFVNDACEKGKIEKDSVNELISEITIDDTFDIDFEVHIADVNPGKKTDNQQIGDTTYYIEYTSQVEKELNDNGIYKLKEGDFIIVSARNTNTTISQMIKSVLYSVTGNQAYAIAAQASGTVVSTGY